MRCDYHCGVFWHGMEKLLCYQCGPSEHTAYHQFDTQRVPDLNFLESATILPVASHYAIVDAKIHL